MEHIPSLFFNHFTIATYILQPVVIISCAGIITETLSIFFSNTESIAISGTLYFIVCSIQNRSRISAISILTYGFIESRIPSIIESSDHAPVDLFHIPLLVIHVNIKGTFCIQTELPEHRRLQGLIHHLYYFSHLY